MAKTPVDHDNTRNWGTRGAISAGVCTVGKRPTAVGLGDGVNVDLPDEQVMYVALVMLP